ncbi:MAG: transcriptional regulator, partial [Bacteroidetes bacterium]|nr:transcriptional regulator [Bacteroidota bacterium]
MTAGAGWAQSPIGLPMIKNFRNTDYHASLEVWDVCQDKRGLLYFANNDGLLTYDGAYWKVYPLPNKPAIKSLAMDEDGRIYTGGQDEVGYFFPDAAGSLQFHSLKEQLPKLAQQFADIWNTVVTKDGVFFKTNEAIFWWKDNKMQVFDAPAGWQIMAQAGGRLYATDKTKGLLVFQNGQWAAAARGEGGDALHITGIVEYAKDTLLLSTVKNGFYLLHDSTLVRRPMGSDQLWANDLVNTLLRIGADRYAVGTRTGGTLIMDGRGEIVQRLTGGEGLQSNNVLCLWVDRSSNLWLGLENGISVVHYNTSVKQIRPVKDNQLLCNAAEVYNGRFYVGTSNGLYSVAVEPGTRDMSMIKGVFSEVENTKGRVWSLADMDGQLFLGNQDGAALLKGNRAVPILTRHGAWNFVKTGDEIVAGTYTGLQAIVHDKGGFTDGGRVSDLYESLYKVSADSQQVVWASHPYRGVFSSAIRQGKTYKHYGVKEGLPSGLGNYVYRVRGAVVVATAKGVYSYDSKMDRFVPSRLFTPILHDTSVECLSEDKEGKVWFVSKQRVGVIDFSKPSVTYFPELTGVSVKGFAFVYPYDNENILVGGNNGLYHLNYSRYIQTNDSLTVLISAVKAIAERDSLIYGGYASNGDVKLANHWNSFHFEYSSPIYSQQAGVEFSYRLEGFDRDWSEWTLKTEKDYTNLSYGRYQFQVRARDNLGNISSVSSFSFEVKPAWYQTFWAYLLYLLLAVGLVYVIRKIWQRRLALHQKKHEEEQARLSYLHSLELDRKEKGLIALQNAKLEGELQFKNKELATATMHLVERGGILLSIKEELQTVIKQLNIPNLSYSFKSVFKMISDTEKADDDWNKFALYFDQVHNNFLGTLK